MKVARGQLARLLDEPGSTVRFYLFWGPDEGQSRAHATRLLQAMGADRFIVISNVIKNDPAALADEAGALALFGGRRVIWIEPAGDEICDGVSAVLEAPAPESPVVAIAPLNARPKELIRIAESSPLALSFASYAPEGQDAERMVADVARRYGLRIERPVAARLAEACGNDQAIVAQELEKIALYLDASTSRPRAVDDSALDAVAAVREGDDSLHLADLAMEGDLPALAEGLAAMGQGNDAIPVLRALQRRLLMLAPARAQLEAGRKLDDVMASFGKSLFWKDKPKVQGMISRWSAAQIARLGERTSELERELLFGDSPPREALGEELIAVARAARRR